MDLNRLRVAGSSASSPSSFEFGLVSREFTRKAKQLSGGGLATIAFHDPFCAGENGYCVLSGTCEEVRNADERESTWKNAWSTFHPGPHHPEVQLWRFRPERMEVISHADSVTQWWKPVTLNVSGDSWQMIRPPAEGATSARS
jgi:hypothetical protein